MDDDRCLICGCCQHDHKGWKHEWTAETSPDPECDHLLTYVTPLSGLDGLYWRCRDCLEHWPMRADENLGDEPDEWDYDDYGNVVDLR